MKVKLINKSPEFLRTVWTAIRTCKSALTPEELWAQSAERPQEDMTRLVFAVIRAGHLSVLEHVSMTFAVSGVSRALLAQYTRHRIGLSFSVQSQRYVSEGTEKNGGAMFDAVTPDTVRRDPDAAAAFDEAMQNAQKSYDRLVAAGVPIEDARFVLPGGACTNFVTSLNLRSMLDVFEKRVTVKGAQWEVREMVQRMADELVKSEPWLAPVFKGELDQ